nr:MAG TPA: hypothetical protein [Caudoviricetes sp.]
MIFPLNSQIFSKLLFSHKYFKEKISKIQLLCRKIISFVFRN